MVGLTETGASSRRERQGELYTPAVTRIGDEHTTLSTTQKVASNFPVVAAESCNQNKILYPALVKVRVLLTVEPDTVVPSPSRGLTTVMNVGADYGDYSPTSLGCGPCMSDVC